MAMAFSISLQSTQTPPIFTDRFLSKPLPTSIPVPQRIQRLRRSTAAVAAVAPVDDSVDNEKAVVFEPKREKLKVVVKTMEKPRLVLKFIWMDKNIGLGLDQMIPGHGCIPLSPYYFWPRKDAWEELKTKLEEKPWISQKRMIILLNQATDIINLWQQAGGNL